MAQIPQPNYKIKVWNEYNNLNNVEKNIFNAFVKAHLKMFRDITIDDNFMTLIQESALDFVENMPSEIREIEDIITKIYKKFDENNRQLETDVKSENDTQRMLKGKLFGN